MSQVKEAPLFTAAPSTALPLGSPWVWAVGTLLVLAYLPLLIAHGNYLWVKEHYQYFPLVPIGALVLAHQRIEDLGALKAGSIWGFLCMMGFSMLLLMFSILIYSPWLGAVSFLFTVLALIYGVGGAILVWHLLPAWLFLWLIIPLPFQLDNTLVTQLQKITARWSSKLLDAIGVLHIMNGNAVQIPGQRLLVDEACSGVHSLFACLTATIFFVIWTGHPSLRGILVVVSAVGWVLIANALRVVLITIAAGHGYLKFADAKSWEHLGLGVLMFLFTLAMVVSSDRLFMFLLSARGRLWRRDPRDLNIEPEPVSWPSWKSTWVGSWASIPLAGFFALVILAQGYLMWPASAAGVAEPPKLTEVFSKLDMNTLPPAWGSEKGGQWRLVNFQTTSRPMIEAPYSRYWVYQFGNKTAYLSVDYPFTGWHDLLICYRAMDWSVESEAYHSRGSMTFSSNPSDASDSEPTTNKIPFYDVDMNLSKLNQGYLMYFLFNNQGSPLETSTFWDKLRLKMTNINDNWRSAVKDMQQNRQDTEFVQVQLFIDSYTELTPEERKAAQQFFFDAANRLQGILAPQAAEPSKE